MSLCDWFKSIRLYRHLLIRAGTKKRECLYLLLVPLSEASRIAYWSWTATQKPTLEYVTIVFSKGSSQSIAEH